MKTVKNQLTFCLLTGFLFVMNACTNTQAENKQPTQNSPLVTANVESKAEPAPTSAAKNALDKAKADSKAAFVVVTGNGIAETNKAVAVAEGAKSIYKNAVVVQMNRDDAANAELVNEWRLTGAPLPLIIVVSSKGILTGGRILAQATAENVAALVPSPKKEEVLSHLNSGKSVFLVISNNKMTEKNKSFSACEQACIEMKEKAKIVSVNTDDPKELVFLKELQIDTNISQPMTYVINAQGQVTGTYTSDVNSSALVASAKKIVSSGCCPTGSGQSCPPAK